MTQQTLTTSFLKHSQPLLTKCLQAALIAAPVLLAAAPSEAVTVKTTVDGFTGVFAPSQWSKDPTITTGGNSVTITGGSMTLRKNLANAHTVSSSFYFSDGVFDALRPVNANGRLLGWVATGRFNLSTSGASPNSAYRFTASYNELPTPAVVTDLFVHGDYYPFSADSKIRYEIANANPVISTGIGTVVIDNFKFTAEYEVPGPLPVVGAAAAFAWSRRLRKRLNSAKTLV